MSNFFTNYLNNLKKIDTILAFFVSFIINYAINRNIKNALIVSILFVVTFLFFLNIIKI